MSNSAAGILAHEQRQRSHSVANKGLQSDPLGHYCRPSGLLAANKDKKFPSQILNLASNSEIDSKFTFNRLGDGPRFQDKSNPLPVTTG